MKKITVLETRAITVCIDTDDQQFAEKMAMATYEDNKHDPKVMCEIDTKIVDGTNDSVDVYLDKDGDLIWDENEEIEMEEKYGSTNIF